MTKAEFIRAELPGLRRYARAVTGSQAMGDALVRAAIEGLAGSGVSISSRLELFQRLEAEIARSTGSKPAADGLAVPAKAKRAALLIEVEGFSKAEAGRILGLSQNMSASASSDEAEAAAAAGKRILIIEDEPLVAAHIAEIVRSMGHTVCGSAASKSAARAACADAAPDLILSDMVLGDDATGGEVAKELAVRYSIPVIYLTAYPENFLKGQEDEPVYLITKPFRSGTVKTMVEQALIRAHYKRAS